MFKVKCLRDGSRGYAFNAKIFKHVLHFRSFFRKQLANVKEWTADERICKNVVV